jgi:hypothetical protein
LAHFQGLDFAETLQSSHHGRRVDSGRRAAQPVQPREALVSGRRQQILQALSLFLRGDGLMNATAVPPPGLARWHKRVKNRHPRQQDFALGQPCDREIEEHGGSFPLSQAPVYSQRTRRKCSG